MNCRYPYMMTETEQMVNAIIERCRAYLDI